MKNKTCFIVGCGRSLLDLTSEEISYINDSEFVLTFNKYIIFSDLVGIIPTHFLLGDNGEKADLTLVQTADKCARHFKEMKFILAKDYQPDTPQYANRQNRILNSYPQSAKISYSQYKLADQEALDYMARTAVYIERYNWLKGGKWAQSLADKIFHFRGSLSGAINLAHIYHPAYDIKLVGVDLTEHAYFFQEVIESDPEKWGIFSRRRLPEDNRHETTVDFKGTHGIQTMFPYIIAQLDKTGSNLHCCNKSSYLVENDYVPYSAVMS